METNKSTTIVGIDEAGRGPLAGRVYAAAVILGGAHAYDGLNDSKKLSAMQRERLYQEITANAKAWGIGFAEVDEIERLNILNASFLAMKRALASIKASYSRILVDGNIFPFEPPLEGEAIIGGDEKIPEIMAASILAKVSRDAYMSEMDMEFPGYGFLRHKGYPTRLHRDLIARMGPCSIHRKTFSGVSEYLKS